MAFFLETTFLAVMFFGWDRVSRGAHLTATWLTAVGAAVSALWILVANAWMQYPAGCTFGSGARAFRDDLLYRRALLARGDQQIHPHAPVVVRGWPRSS